MHETGNGAATERKADAQGGRFQSAAMPSARPDVSGRHESTHQSPFIRSKRVIVDSVAAFDFLSIVGASAAAKWAYVGSYLDSEQDIGMYLALGVVGGVVAIMSFRSQKLYSPDLLTNFRGQMSRILFGLAVTALVLLGIGYMLKVSAQFSRGWMLSWFGISVVFLSLGHLAVARALRRWTAMGYFARNVAIYGSSEIAEKIIARSSLQGEGIRIFGVFDDLLAGATPRVVVAGGRRVARRFVPGYNTAAAIRLSAEGPRRALARRQLARLIEPRRVVS